MEFLLDYLLNLFSNFGYLGIFAVLFLCGLGLPIPEDITIFTAGYLSFTGRINLFPAFLVCMSGVLLGDLTIYTIGRIGGSALIEKKFFQRIFTTKRLNKAISFSMKYGGKTVFFARFLPGLRAPIYLTAGFIKLNIFKFIILDLCAAIISVPLILFISYHFGAEIDQALEAISKMKNVGIFIVLFVVIAFIIIHKVKKKLIS
ncbi:MAG: DedA family protein [Pseudomonadota bacterium]